MPHDGPDRSKTGREIAPPAPARRRLAEGYRASRRTWLGLGLPLKLLLLTAAFVMLAEVLIFVPSIANFRLSWLNDRLTASHLAVLAAEAVPDGKIPDALRMELLRTASVKAVAIRRAGQRRMVLSPDDPMTIDAHFDLRSMPSGSALDEAGRRFAHIGDALAVYVRGNDRTIRILGNLGMGEGDFIEVVLPEAPLQAAMLRHGLNILGLSIIISLITAALVYVALSSLLVRPMMRISRNMLHFAERPEDQSRIIEPSERTDEIGVTERELASMQRQLSHLLLQKSRLAQLGLAVSKINHDLRNMLASAQLISDRLTTLPDPTVQRFAPKLIASLDRAISFCNDTLRFGRAEEAEPRRELMLLRPLLEEVGDGLGLPRESGLGWHVEVDPLLRVDADREHLYRVLNNICRNAVQVLEALPAGRVEGPGQITVTAWRAGREVTIEVRDDGPGVPERARGNLFTAFASSQRKGGTGLGLAIAAELVAAHGGRIWLVDSDRGAVFRIAVPDRTA